MPITAQNLVWKFSGGGSNVDPAASLGGSPGGDVPDATMAALFDDVDRPEIIAGDREYRCVYVYNEHGSLDLRNARIFVFSNTPYDRTSVGLALAGGIGEIAATIDAEGTRPAGNLHVADRRTAPITAQNTLSSLFASHGGARLHQAFGNDIHSFMMAADRRSVTDQGTERDLGNNFPRDIEGAVSFTSGALEDLILAGGTPGSNHWKCTNIVADGSFGVFYSVAWQATHAPASVDGLTANHNGTRVVAAGKLAGDTISRVYTWSYSVAQCRISGSNAPVALAYPVVAIALAGSRLFMLRENDGMLISWAWSSSDGALSDELHHGHPFGSGQLAHAGMTRAGDVLIIQRRGGTFNEMVTYLVSASGDLIEFSNAPDYDHGLDVGTLQSSEGIAVWVERTILPTPDGTGYQGDGAVIRIMGDTPP